MSSAAMPSATTHSPRQGQLVGNQSTSRRGVQGPAAVVEDHQLVPDSEARRRPVDAVFDDANGAVGERALHHGGHAFAISEPLLLERDRDVRHLPPTGLVGAQKRLSKGAADRAAPVERSVIVVGDDDQAIFGFRKASVEFLRRFEEEFQARRICLVDCFRSHPRVVEVTSKFAASLPGRLKQVPDEQVRSARGMESAPPEGDAARSAQARAVRRFRYATRRAITAHCEFVIEKSLKAGAQSIAVLAREWNELHGLRGLLEQRGIPFTLAHRDFHRPLHRRYPCDRVLRELWKRRELVDGRARDLVASLLTAWGRGPEDPVVYELLRLVDELDVERSPTGLGGTAPASRAPAADSSEAGEGWPAIDPRELADRLLLAAREGARRGGGGAGAHVHLGTFHGAKGLEFDKVVVLPCAPREGSDHDEERRLYYVAMTRARNELVLATMGAPGEIALEVEAPEEDLRRWSARFDAPEIVYLDCDPSDVVLQSIELGRAQAAISHLREGQPLLVRETDRGVDLMVAVEPGGTGDPTGEGGAYVGTLSARGRERYRRLRAALCPLARVHEVFVHLVRGPDGDVQRRVLVVLPSFCFGRDSRSS